jgi:hypothetical protein
MSSHPGTTTEVLAPRERHVWLAILLLLCLWTAWRMGAFDLTTTVTVDGRSVDVANTYATVDHPFHATRAYTLLESLKNVDILRWVGNHQGGYPVEFYPLGVAWLDVGLWALLLGSVPIIAVHKLAVIAIFLLPALSFWILARGDRLHPGVAVMATAAHVAIPGHWLNGGYSELVGWGLVTNVAGGSLALLAAGALARFVLRHERGMGLLATAAAAAGALSNPRSLFAVVIAALAILIAAALMVRGARLRDRVLDAVVRISLVGGTAALIAAPVILSLMRYQAEYFFLHYNDYEPLSLYWSATRQAVTPVIALLALGGALVPWLRGHFTVLRAMSLALFGYVLFTIWVETSSRTPPLVEQLEAPRLMPFQRQVMIYLGAAFLGLIIQAATAHWRGWAGAIARASAVAAAALAVLFAFVRPLGVVPEFYRGAVASGGVPEVFQGLSPVSTTGNTDFAQFERAVDGAELLRTPGTSMFIIGNRDDWWHEQLWAPTRTDAPLYYDDWLWYWTTTHNGPYDYHNGHYFPNPTDALTPEYLGDNGVSVVLVTDMFVSQGEAPRAAARTNPNLAFDTTVGAWDIYRVRQPTAIVTNGGALPASIAVNNERITARFDDGDGTIVVRRNWFPRWKATVNGESVEIDQRSDGYMEVHVPAGAATVELRYAVTAVDWAARAASLTGVIVLLIAIVFGGRLERRFASSMTHNERNVPVQQAEATGWYH